MVIPWIRHFTWINQLMQDQQSQHCYLLYIKTPGCQKPFIIFFSVCDNTKNIKNQFTKKKPNRVDCTSQDFMFQTNIIKTLKKRWKSNQYP